jgi:hypothetical protein
MPPASSNQPFQIPRDLVILAAAAQKLAGPIGDSLYSSGFGRMVPPVLDPNLHDDAQKIAGMEVPLHEGITLQMVERERHEMLDPDSLAEHQTEILDRELDERLPP